MSDALEKTLDILSRSENGQSVDVLAAGMDGDNETVQVAAAEALLESGSARAKAEVVRRSDSLSTEVRDRIGKRTALMDEAIDQALLTGSDEVRRSALADVRRNEQFARLGAVIELRLSVGRELADECDETVRHLVDRAQFHVSNADSGGMVKALGRHVRDVRRELLVPLDKALDDPRAEPIRELLIESILRIGQPDGAAVRRILWQGSAEVTERAAEMIRTSDHPGTLGLLMDSMASKHMHPVVLECMKTRTDAPFVESLLRWLPAKPTDREAERLQQVNRAAWMSPERVAELPGELHDAAVRFADCTSCDRDSRDALMDWVVRNGSPEGRHAASGFLDEIDESESRAIVFEALANGDPATQAWAMGRLRASGAAEAIALLVERLDSDVEEVRTKAREELQGFSLPLMLRIHAHLPRDVCLNAGRIISKIDPDHVEKLRGEIGHAVRQRRLNAISAALAFGMHHTFERELITMMSEDDVLVRRAAAEVLGEIPSAESIRTLMAHVKDPSQRVRDTVVAAIQRVREVSAEHAARAAEEAATADAADVPEPVGVAG